jgi:hypothetical protein
MMGSQKRRRQNQGPTLTLKLLQQAPDGTLLLDDLEESSVPLLPDRRQFCNHSGADQTRLCNHGQRIRI